MITSSNAKVLLCGASALLLVNCFSGGGHHNGSGGAGGATTSAGGSLGSGGFAGSISAGGAAGSISAGGSLSAGGSSGGVSAGGTFATGGAAGTVAQGGSGGSAQTCASNPLPIDETGWVDITSNGCGIQGPWYWFYDAVGTTVNDAVADTPPYRVGSGMCLSGSTVVDETYAAYGATIGFDLSQPTPGGASVPYDATSHGITGFQVTISGSFTQELRLGFAPISPNTQAAPFFSITAPGVYNVLFSQAQVPISWTVPNAGETVNPSSVASVQLQISGGDVAASFDVCITSIKPIVN